MSLIDDCNEVPTSMENWLHAGADWSEHHGITDPTTSAPLFYGHAETATPGSAISLFENLRKEHPFLKLDALEICKENPDAALLVVRTSGSPSVGESSSTSGHKEEKLSETSMGGLSATSLLDRMPSLDDAAGLYVEADHSPRGPLSPAALKSPRTGSNKRDVSWVVPVADLQTRSRKSPQNDLGQAYAPFVAMATAATSPAAAAPSFVPVPVPVPVPAAGNDSIPNSIAAPVAAPIAGPTAILFPAPLTLPVVPSMEEIAQTRPKRRNVRISKDPTSVAARHRRERISDRVRVLQHFVPGGTKMDTASMLDEAIHYVKFLQQQLQMLERLGNSYDPMFMTPEDPMMMSHVGNSVRPFDLNRVCYQQTFPSSSMAHLASQQPPQPSWPNTKATSAFYSQGFPEQFCH